MLIFVTCGKPMKKIMSLTGLLALYLVAVAGLCEDFVERLADGDSDDGRKVLNRLQNNLSGLRLDTHYSGCGGELSLFQNIF